MSFLNKIRLQEFTSFAETIAVITEYYDYHPAEFRNGTIVNAAGINEGSCKIFAFAHLHQLSQQQTLGLFGDYYHQDVLNNPDSSNHANIRNFMRYGWDGIQFNGIALTAKKEVTHL
jgi:HopJ type III effector protein